MADERLRNKSELKRLFTNLRGKNITEEMMSIAIDSLWRDKLVQRTSGFEFPGHFDSEISFNTSTRIFSIKAWDPLVVGFIPRYGIYSYLDHPIFHRHFEPFEIEIPNEEGLFCVYFDNEPAPGNSLILFYKKNPTQQELEDIYVSKIVVSCFYWDATNDELLHFGEDRHGSEWNPHIQWYLHSVFGAKRKSGLQIAGFTLNGDGTLNSHATFSVTGGVMLHDDIEMSITGKGPGLPILYAFGGLPRFIENNGYAFYSGASRPCFNSGLNSISEAASGSFILYHIFATNELVTEARKIVSVMGAAQYSNLARAFKAIDSELDSIYAYMPFQGRCYLDTIILEVNDAYANDVKARIVFFGTGISHPPVTIHEDSIQYLEIDEFQVLKLNTEDLGDSGPVPDENVITGVPVVYGAFYNWHSAADSRQISSSAEWNLLTYDKMVAICALFPSADGGVLKEAGTAHWLTPNTGATNEVGFNLRGTGYRTYPSGAFDDLLESNRFWILDDHWNSTTRFAFGTSFDSDAVAYFFPVPESSGLSIRLCRNATAEELLLPDGTPCTPYVGNNLIKYNTIKLGTLVCMADYLNENKYRNGDWITGFENGVYTPISNINWAAKITEAMCYYSDNTANGEGEKTLESVLIDLQKQITEKAVAGEDGITPHIGINGNWYIGETDTGIPAQGQDGSPGADGAPGTNGTNGITPYIEGGYWYIDGVSTGVLAVGQNGMPGTPGTNGLNGIDAGGGFEFCVTSGTAQTETLDLHASANFTISKVVLESNGTLNSVTIKIGATAITGVNAVAVSTLQEFTPSANNVVVLGNRITIEIGTGYSGNPTIIRGKILA